MGTIQLFETLKLWLKRSLAVYVAALAVESVACLGVIAILAGAGDAELSPGRLHAVGLSMLVMASASFVEVGLNIVIAVLFLRMLYKAVQRAKGFATPFTYVSPGWAVGY